MRRVGTWGLAAALVIFAARTLPADEAEDLSKDIQALGDQKVSPAGKSADAYKAEIVKAMQDLIAKCEDYRKRFPDGAQLGAVLYEEAKAYFYVSPYWPNRKEAQDKSVELAQAAVKRDPKADPAAKAHGLLLGYYKSFGKFDEALNEAKAIVADFPTDDFAPLALAHMAEIYEKQKKPDDVTATLEKLAKEFPGTTHGKRAAGVLAARKLKGTVAELSFVATDGKTVDIKNYRGKVVLIVFYASTDRSGASLANQVATMQKDMRDRGLVALGVSMDTDRAAFDAFMAKTRIDWPQYFEGKKWDNDLVLKFGVTAMPASMLIDRTGKVREMGLLGGALTAATQALLDEKAGK